MNIDPKQPDALNPAERDPVERLLPALTTWPGDAPQVWKEAIERRRRPPVTLGWRTWALRIGTFGAAAAVVLLSVMVGSRAHSAAEGPSPAGRVAIKNDTAKGWDAPKVQPGAASPGTTLWDLVAGEKSTVGLFTSPSAGDSADDLRNSGYADLKQLGYVGSSGPADRDGLKDARTRADVVAHGGMIAVTPPAEPLSRQVVQKLALDLIVEDVPQTFLKIQLLVSDAHGEYIGQSNLSGSDATSRASITLRVRPERLSGVLNELRTLGEVRSETAAAEDVTQQVVDVESRLRNERQVETELLKLLAARSNDKLEEILMLRQHIAAVRERIETLVGRRESLAKLTGLATVLVTLSPPNAPPLPQPWIGTFFYDALNDAVRSGAHYLANTLAGLVAILIGGAPWWCVLAAAIWWVRRRATLGDRVARGA